MTWGDHRLTPAAALLGIALISVGLACNLFTAGRPVAGVAALVPAAGAAMALGWSRRGRRWRR